MGLHLCWWYFAFSCGMKVVVAGVEPSLLNFHCCGFNFFSFWCTNCQTEFLSFIFHWCFQRISVFQFADVVRSILLSTHWYVDGFMLTDFGLQFLVDFRVDYWQIQHVVVQILDGFQVTVNGFLCLSRSYGFKKFE